MSTGQSLVAGRYQLIRRIGSGAMGVVWEAQDERLNRTVAVKQLLIPPGLDPAEAEEAKLRTMREGRIAARLHHPNAVSVFDVVDESGAPCLVMEYVPSRSLDDVLKERGALSPLEVARIGTQVAAALAAAHAAGIVHRDIKPGNVLLGNNGIVKITDFGISRATDDVTVTKTGLIAGTPAYLAPEVAIGRDPTAAADVFSLGSTLYAAVEGKPPFGLSENTLGLLHAVAAGQIDPPRHAGPLTNVLAGLLQADPAIRPTARQALGMLQAVARGETPELPVTFAGTTQAFGGAGGVGTTRAMTSISPDSPVDYEQRERSSTSGRGWAITGVVVAVLVLAGVLFATGMFSGDKHTQQPLPNNPPATEAPYTAGNLVPPSSAGTRTTDQQTATTTTTSVTTTSSNAPTVTTTKRTTTTTTPEPTSSASTSIGTPTPPSSSHQ